jgi:hypothetical protein
VSLPTLTFRTVCTDARCTATGTCWRAANERYGDAPGENYGPRCVPVRATVQGTVRPNLAPPATLDAPERPLTNDDLARAYDMGRDLERADTVAWLREEYDTNSTRIAADEIERGDHIGAAKRSAT